MQNLEHSNKEFTPEMAYADTEPPAPSAPLPKQLPVPEDLLARLRKEHADMEQFKKVANLELQVKELQYKNTILEIYVRMGLRPTDSFDINTGLAEVK